MQKKGFIVNKIHLISLLDIKGEFSPIHMKLVGNVKSPFRRLEAPPTSSGTDAAEYKRLQVAEHPSHSQPIIQMVSVCLMMIIITIMCQGKLDYSGKVRVFKRLRYLLLPCAGR